MVEEKDIYFWIENYFPIAVLEIYFLRDMKNFKEKFTFSETTKEVWEKLTIWHRFVEEILKNEENVFIERKLDHNRLKKFLEEFLCLLKD